MRFRTVTRSLGVLAALILALPVSEQAAAQALVLQQNLSEMVAEADRIYRGQVLSIKSEEIDINGTLMPSVHYRVLVTDHFKGDVDQEKGDQRIADFRVIGSKKKYLRKQGDFALMNNLPKPPDFKVGSEYLLMTNAPNAFGLSNTIGLAQGCFAIQFAGDEEMAANELDNLGLFRDMGTDKPVKGAVPYADLANMIRNEMAYSGGQ